MYRINETDTLVIMSSSLRLALSHRRHPQAKSAPDTQDRVLIETTGCGHCPSNPVSSIFRAGFQCASDNRFSNLTG